MTRVAPRALLAALLLAGGVSACAPEGTGTTFASYAVGGSAAVTYGTVVGARPVTIRGRTGVGTAAGAFAGGIGGSSIGGDWRASLLAGLGGVPPGGSAGTASAGAVEFVVREDGGDDIATVQTNEEGLGVGDRVAILRGDRTRLARAGGRAPARPLPSAATGSAMVVAGLPGGVPPAGRGAR